MRPCILFKSFTRAEPTYVESRSGAVAAIDASRAGTNSPKPKYPMVKHRKYELIPRKAYSKLSLSVKLEKTPKTPSLSGGGGNADLSRENLQAPSATWTIFPYIPPDAPVQYLCNTDIFAHESGWVLGHCKSLSVKLFSQLPILMPKLINHSLCILLFIQQQLSILHRLHEQHYKESSC